MSEQPLGLAEVRRGLRTIVQPPERVSERQHEIASRSLTAAALLLLLPPTPVEGRHTVDDIPPSPGTHETPDGEKWTWSWEHVQVMVEHDVEPENRYPVILTKAAYRWLSVEDAEAVAAELLSAAARARAQQERSTDGC